MHQRAVRERMPTREFGSTGAQVSIIGFGASPLGGVFGEVDEEEGAEAVREAANMGINLFDTSPFYGLGESERVLGKGLARLDRPREEVMVCTKVGRYGQSEFDFSRERVERSVEESMARLGVSYLDVVHLHDVEFVSIERAVTHALPALQRYQQEGKIRFIGCSGLPLTALRRVISTAGPGAIAACLSYCRSTLFDSSFDSQLIPHLESSSIAPINASPLAMGLLTRQGPPPWHPAPDQLKLACRDAADKCDHLGADIADIALRASISRTRACTTLVGMASREEVRANIATAQEAALKRLVEPELTAFRVADSALEPVRGMTWPSGLPENNDRDFLTPEQLRQLDCH